MVHYAAAALFASGLVASVSAGSVHANHANLHKKGLEAYKAPEYKSASSTPAANTTCGCTTYTTTWYGTPGLVPGPSTTSTPAKPTTYAAPSSSSSSPAAPVYTSSSSAPVYSAPSSSSAPSYSAPAPSSSSSAPVYKPETSAPVYSSAPAPSSSAAPSYSAPASKHAAPSYSSPASSAPSSTPSKGSNGGCAEISPNGDKWAMTYTPYTTGGQCKSADQVSQDIMQIKAKGFTTVRLYATDCSGVINIGAACDKYGLNMILGVYIDSAGISKAREQVSVLANWGKSSGWGKVEMVVVGNEAVFNGYCTASELASFIAEVKSSFKSAGYTGPCTTTEPLNVIQENANTLCSAVDVMGANIHPFFNTAIDASGAGDFVASQLKLVESACGNGMAAYNLETGWPSAGNANGAAIPGVSEQKTAVDGILASAGAKSAIFSYENDSWKSPGDLGVEQYWGCANIFQDVMSLVDNVMDSASDMVSDVVDSVM